MNLAESERVKPKSYTLVLSYKETLLIMLMVSTKSTDASIENKNAHTVQKKQVFAFKSISENHAFVVVCP